MTRRLGARRAWLLLMALVVALALVAAACGGGSDTDEAAAGGGATTEAAAGGEATTEQAATAPAESETSTGAASETTEEGGIPSWCGPEEVVVGLADGFGGNNWRRITTAEARDEASKCPSVKDLIYTDGQGNVQKAISDINGLVAQGVDALVVFPDASEAVLPALRAAYNAGVVTVPYRVFPGGEDGKDYNVYVKTDFCADAIKWADWMGEALNGEGKVIYLGGPAGNSQSKTRSECLNKELKEKYPGIEVIGQAATPGGFEVTNWDPALTQQVITALLAKYPQIDGWFTDFGAAFASSLSAFDQAGREVGPVATEDSNAFACAMLERGVPFMSVSSQNWMSRTAIQYAVALASGGTPPSSPTVENFVFDDSINGEVHCDESLPGDAILSSKLTKEQLASVLQ